MTPEERAAKIVADGHWIAADYYTDEAGEECRQEAMNVTLLQRAIADAIRAAELAAVERCARVAAFVLEHEPHNAAALPHLLRTRPEMDVCDLSGPPKDLNFPAGFVIGGES